MANSVRYFEVMGKDGKALRSFYRELFGWSIAEPDHDLGYDYGRIEPEDGGVPGAQRARATAGAKSRAAKGRTTGTRSRAGAPRGRSSVRNTRSTQADGGQFDRDKLLAVVFPNGVPAKVSVIEALAPWLAEAERLSRMR